MVYVVTTSCEAWKFQKVPQLMKVVVKSRENSGRLNVREVARRASLATESEDEPGVLLQQ